MPTFYGPPSDGTVIPADLEDALAADIVAPESAIGAAGSTAFGRKRQQTMVVLGDSLTEQGGMISAAPNLQPKAAWSWANVLLGQSFEILKNAGIGGQTTAQIRARLQDDVLALRPGWCHLLAGTNNMGSAAGVAAAKSDLTAMLDALDGAGIMTVLGTLPPRITSTYTGTIKADTMELNRWIVAQARARRNVILVDYFQALADTGGNFSPTVAGWNTTTDGVHLSAAGAYACGGALATALRAAGATPAYPFAPNAPGPNLLPYPYLNGADPTAAPLGTTLSGGASGTATWSTEQSLDLPAVPWRVLTVQNGAGNLSVQQNANVGANGLAVGDKVRAYIEFDVSNLDQAAAAGQQAFHLSVRQWNGSAYTSTVSAMSDYSAPNAARSGAFFVPDVTVAADTAVVTVELFIWGGGKYKLRRIGLYKSGTFTA